HGQPFTLQHAFDHCPMLLRSPDTRLQINAAMAARIAGRFGEEPTMALAFWNGRPNAALEARGGLATASESQQSRLDLAGLLGNEPLGARGGCSGDQFDIINDVKMLPVMEDAVLGRM